MKLEEADNRFNTHPHIAYFLFGYRVEDGVYRLDCAACIDREDARKEAEKFEKYVLYDISKSKNQNL